MSTAIARGAQGRALLLFALLANLCIVATAVAAGPPQPVAVPAAEAVAGTVQPLPRTTAERALLAILDEGRAQVDALLAEAMADPARAGELQQEICRVKSETNVRFLEKQVELARASGDAVRLEEAQQALDNAVNPPAPESVSTSAAQGVVK